MSASREKKARQELNESGYVDPRKAREAEEKAKERRSTRIYTAVIVAFVLLGVVLFASGRIQASNEAKETARIGAESAVTIDGEDFSVNDVAYYYGSIYNTFANNGSSFGFDSSKSAREQQYTEGKTWHDYFLESALDYMKESVAVAHAAEAAGFDGAEQMDSAEQSNLSMIDLYASYSGATRAQYLTAMFGKYMTEEAFVRCVRRDALARAYQQSYSDSLTYSAADLQAAYDEDPDAYCSVDIEYVSFTTGLSSDATDAEKSAAMEEAKAKAEAVLAAYAEGRSFEESAGDGTYMHLAHADRSVTSDMLTWAFAADRAEGDTTVAEQSSGYVAVLFHSRSRDDYHPVTVRHILVEDEATAKEILADMHKKGYVHNVLYMFGKKSGAFVMCNCDREVCAVVKGTRILGPGINCEKGPEVIKRDRSKCLGAQECGMCVKRCPFGANKIKDGMVIFDKEKCMGCELCVATCKGCARELEERKDYGYDEVMHRELLLAGKYGRPELDTVTLEDNNREE